MSDSNNSEENLSFGQAIEALEDGQRVARSGWNGKGMWLRLVKTGSYDVACGYVYPNGTHEEAQGVISLLPWIGMKTADSKFVPWLASQSDVLAKDWCVVSG
jgi:hypothetical protein